MSKPKSGRKPLREGEATVWKGYKLPASLAERLERLAARQGRRQEAALVRRLLEAALPEAEAEAERESLAKGA